MVQPGCQETSRAGARNQGRSLYKKYTFGQGSVGYTKPKMSNASDDGEIVRASDFVSVRLRLTFKNLVSGVSIADHDEVTLDEVGDKQLVLGVPLNSCNVEHNVLFEIERTGPSGPKGKPVLKATGKVAAIEKDEESRRMRATVNLVQFDEQSWQELLKFFRGRQEEITKFLAAVRG